PGCPAGVFAAVGTIWGASKLGGRNITKYLQPRKSPLARSRFKRDNCGKPTHFPLGKADGTVEETGVSTRCTAGVGDPASKNRLLEITSGSCRGQQGLVTTCKDSPNEAKSRRRREPQRERRMSPYERRRRSNVLSGDGSRLPNGGNTCRFKLIAD